MNITGILIPANGEERVTKVEFDRTDLRQMQGFVDGNLQVTDIDEIETSLWYNDEGKLIDLPINYRATFLLWVQRPEFREVGDTLVGDILVTGLPDDDGDTQSVPDELVILLFETARYHVTWRFIGKEERNRQSVVFTDWPTAFEYACQMQHRNKNIEEVRVVPA